MANIVATVAAIITALDDTGGSPESMLYVFLGTNMDLWTKVRDVLIDGDLITVSGHYVTLTQKGKETAGKLNAAMRKAS